ncbi:MAG: hypothetical protein Kow0098_23180 [Ignavibacteriaceae bacterium]
MNFIFKTAILLCFILNINSALAQDNQVLTEREKAVVAEMVSKLQQKVLLSDTQSEKVLPIVTEFAKKIRTAGDSSGEILMSYQGQLTAIMDARQKAKYDIIKKDWWSSLTEELNKANE